MKHHLFIFLLGALPFISLAQVSVDLTGAGANEVFPLCEQMRKQGRVAIQQDVRLENLLGRQQKTYNAATHVQTAKSGQEVLYTTGFRVRVFSGNNQTVSKNEAYAIESELKEYMPDLETYVIFKTPNWRLMVGNYRTMEEATAALRDLKKKFPVYGREMFVVKDEIELAL
ncbi:MAG: SPOR domain-containing protein [Bacteroidales bacterium]|nr:SPOR domain-containing protein [Bacteroidales bacterium]